MKQPTNWWMNGYRAALRAEKRADLDATLAKIDSVEGGLPPAGEKLALVVGQLDDCERKDEQP